MVDLTVINNQQKGNRDVPRPKSNSKRQRSKLVSKVNDDEIAFVNLTGSSGPTQDAEKRKIVRAHVMRSYQRKKQQEEGGYRSSYQYRLVDPPAISSTNELPVLLLKDTAIMPDSEPPSTIVSAGWDTAVRSEINSPTRGTGSNVAQQLEDRQASGRKFEGHATTRNNQNLTSDESASVMITLNSPGDLSNISNLSTLNTSIESNVAEADLEEVEYPVISQILPLKLSFNALNSGKLDPFDAMPGLRNARAQALMHHYNQVLVKTLIPVNPKDKWFNFAISDDALFHATMLHSAAHNSMLVGNSDLGDPIQLNTEAIRILNSRLGDPTRGISDLTIAAVACLILFENQLGNKTVSNIHMAGLVRMIQMRGGIDTLGLAGVLKRKVLWADVCNAMLSNTMPRFNLNQEGLTLTMTTSIASLWSSSTSSQICDCDGQLQDIIVDLRILSANPPINALDGLISDKLYLVERRLVVLINSFNDSSHKPHCHSVSKAAFLAALIYLYTYLRDYPVQAPLFNSFIQSLGAALFSSSSSYDQGWQESNPSLLLWILTTVALAAAGRPERLQFVRELARMVTRMRITTFQEFVAAARQMVWIDRKDPKRDAAWRLLWRDIDALTWEL